MMKKFIIILLALNISLAISAKKQYSVYAVGFYNVENLFDTENDPAVIDEDFTPTGLLSWTLPKYQKKLENIAYVIDKMGKNYAPQGLAILGVAEVENRKVLEDLVKTEPIARKNYQIVHYDSPDKRGIDVALLYDPLQFKVISSRIYPYNDPDTTFCTRDHLLVSGLLAGELTHIIVNHWPSRWGGDASSPKREHAAANVKHIADSLYKADPTSKIIIMGDLNDDPTNKSCRVVLDAKRRQSEVKEGGLFNTMWEYYAKGIGSLGYKGQWNLFDQIIISKSLLSKDNSQLNFWKAEIFNREFLITKEGKDKGYPHRTFRDNTFINGYSDHFPTLIFLIKEIK